MNNFDSDEIIKYVTVIILSCFAGIVDYVNRKHKSDVSMKTILFNLFAKLLMSAFAGLLTYWILQENSENHVVLLNGYSAVAISLSGYAGNQFVNIISSMWLAITEKGVKK